MGRPADCRYAETHEWVRMEGDLAVVGITDFAVEQLSDLVFADLPRVGTEVAKGGKLGEIESVKAVSDLYAPVSGTVKEVNEALANDLDALAKSPFGDGWMVKLAPSDASEMDGLLDAEAYEKHVRSEAH